MADRPDRRDAQREVEDRAVSPSRQDSSQNATAPKGTEKHAEGEPEMETPQAESGGTGDVPPPKQEQKRDKEIKEGVKRPESKEDWDRFIIA